MESFQMLAQNRQEILRIAALLGARNLRVFGSFARGEANDKSDVDLLVDMDDGRSLMDLGGLQMELQTLLARSVDLVTERGLKDHIRERVRR